MPTSAIIRSYQKITSQAGWGVILSDQDIKKFQDLHKSTFGEDISYEDAHEQAVKLLRLMTHIYKPMTEEEHNYYLKEREERYRAFLASQA